MPSKVVNGFVINTGLEGAVQRELTRRLEGCLEDSDTTDATLRILGRDITSLVAESVLQQMMNDMKLNGSRGAWKLWTPEHIRTWAALQGYELEKVTDQKDIDAEELM